MLHLTDKYLILGAYSLTIKDWDGTKGYHVKHYKIKTMDTGEFYISHTEVFDTLADLVEHHKGWYIFF